MNFAVEVIKFCEKGLPDSQATKVITYQLIKAATSTASNYRAACRARSGREFFAKLSIAVEEADESHCWLEMINRLGNESNKKKLEWLLNEAKEITAILAKSRKTAGEKNSNTK